MTGPVVSLAAIDLAKGARRLQSIAARAGLPGGIMVAMAAAQDLRLAQEEHEQAYGKRVSQ